MKFGGGASRKLSLSFLLFYLFCSWTVSYASSITERETLTDGWGGVQKALEDNGLTIGLAYVADMGSVTGGAEDKSFIYLDNVDITFTVDTEKAGLWHGGTFFVYILSNHGDNPSRYAGDIQVTSNIESQDSTRLYEFWYEQSFMDGDLSVLGGLHDLNSEFLVTEYGGLFLNSSFGIQPNVSANAPVSIFNVTSPAIRVKGKVTNAITLLAGIYDGGVGYPEGNPNGLDLKIDPDNEGVFSIVEADFKTGQGKDKITSLPGVYKVGAWRHTGHFAKHLNSGASSGNNGFYFIADQMVYREYGNQGLGIFLQYGVAPKDRNLIDSYLGLGFNYTGLIPGRDEDTFGIAMAKAHVSKDFAQALGVNLTEETTIEITYKAPIFPWLIVQPNVQIINNPGADPMVDTATVSTLRFEVLF